MVVVYRSTCISPLQLRTGGFCWCKVLLPTALAGGNQCIQIREEMLEFSSVVLSKLSLYLKSITEYTSFGFDTTLLFSNSNSNFVQESSLM